MLKEKHFQFTEEDFESYWQEWSAKEECNYKIKKNKEGNEVPVYLKKGYTHFDLRFWFPDRKDELKTILKNKLHFYNKSHKRDEWWAFSPFLKILLKTPRYKYQAEDDAYDLETKIRPICFASHIDGLIFGFYSFALTKQYEKYIGDKKFDDCVLAYRSNLDGHCNIQFSKEVFEEVRSRGECTAIALDIKGYFDHINHDLLLEKWNKMLGEKMPDDQYKLFKALTKYSYVSKTSILKKYNVNLESLEYNPRTLLQLIPGDKDFEKFNRLRTDKLIVQNGQNKKEVNKIGIPQGSGMSALLSNVYLIDFDETMYEKSIAEGFLYRRYCDDILIVCDSAKSAELEKFAIEIISKDYFLEIQSKKVETTEFKRNSKGRIRSFNKRKMTLAGIENTTSANEHLFYKSLQYLGFEFNGQDIFIRSSSLSRYFRKMKSRIDKTVSMAYSNTGKSNKVWKEQLFHRYTHLGKRNFLKYAYNASKESYSNSKGIIKVGMNSPAIKKQLRRHFEILLTNLGQKNFQQAKQKNKKLKSI